MAFDVGAVEPWSAETPRLYEATVSCPGETVSLRLGFRTVADCRRAARSTADR